MKMDRAASDAWKPIDWHDNAQYVLNEIEESLLAAHEALKGKRSTPRLEQKRHFLSMAMDQIRLSRIALDGDPDAARPVYHAAQAMALTLIDDAMTGSRLVDKMKTAGSRRWKDRRPIDRDLWQAARQYQITHPAATTRQIADHVKATVPCDLTSEGIRARLRELRDRIQARQKP